MSSLTEQVQETCTKYGAPSYIRDLFKQMAGAVDALRNDMDTLLAGVCCPEADQEDPPAQPNSEEVDSGSDSN